MKYSSLLIRKIIFSSIVVIAIPLSAKAEPQVEPGAFQGGFHEKQFSHGDRDFRFPPELQLSENQRDKIFSIKHTQESLFYEQSKVVRKAHLDLRNLASSDQYDDEKAKIISDKLGKAMATILYLKVQEKHQIFELLSPEQRNFLKSHQSGRFDRHSMHPGGHEDAGAMTSPHS